MSYHRFQFVAFATFVSGLCAVGCSHGEGEKPPAATAATSVQSSGYTPPEDVRVVTVTVQDVDKDNHTVTFKAHVLPEANIERNGSPIKIDQVKKGDTLRMYVDTRTGEVVRADVFEGQQ
jgi:hypothetical protein